MGGRRALMLVAAGTLAFTGLPATPAAAAAAAAIEFRCVGHAPVWPSIGGNYAECHGTANDVWTDVTLARACVPECDFYMTINYQTSVCVPPASSVAGTFRGQMHISGGGSYDYRATLAGPLVVFTPPQVAGAGILVLRPPMPTCGASGPATFDMAGVVTLSP